MKFSISSLLLVHALSCTRTAVTAQEDDCTRGKLFITDSASRRMVTIDGAAADSVVVLAADWGSEEKQMTDGVTNLIHTGVYVEKSDKIQRSEPHKIVNAEIGCSPFYNTISANGFLGVFCDGYREEDVIISASSKILDESKFQGSSSHHQEMTMSALVVDFQVAGSHHGNSMAVDDGVVL